MKHWVILIGIDDYVEKPLQGCARDVRMLTAFLDLVLPEADKQIFSTGTVGVRKCQSPTYDNVIRSFDRVIGGAAPGDSVYIHFSGHGSREYGEGNVRELALVLLDDINGERYLWGADLTYHLQGMVQQGLRLTLVLDCCFSGAVSRNESNVRFVPYDAGIASAYPRPARGSPQIFDPPSAHRNAIIQPAWLIDPKGYTILTACGPHERAREERYERDPAGTAGKTGALSFFLTQGLHFLATTRADTDALTFYKHLCARFRVSESRQTPQLYGKLGFPTWTRVTGEIRHDTMSVLRLNGEVYLDCGKAHGVAVGDHYIVSPLGAEGNQGTSTADAVTWEMEVVEAHGLGSRLKLVDSTLEMTVVETGWVASLLRRGIRRSIDVFVRKDVPNRDAWVVDSRHGVFLSLNKIHESSCTFTVRYNDDSYELVDRSGNLLLGIPPIMAAGEDSRQHVLDVLEHLAVFKVFEHIENHPTSVNVASSLNIKWTDTSGHEFIDQEIFHVIHGQELSLNLENTGVRALYISIYNLTPLWQIHNMVRKDEDPDGVLVLAPKNSELDDTGSMQATVRMTIPDSLISRNVNQCQEVLKFFASYEKTSFASFEMPDLITSIARQRSSTTRRPSQALADLLARLQASLYRSPSSLVDEWATRSFVIETTRDKEG